MVFSFQQIEKRVGQFLFRHAPAVLLSVLIVVLSIVDSSFLSFRNFKNIISLASPRLLSASAFALLLLAGYVDVSLIFSGVLMGIIASSLFQTSAASMRLYCTATTVPLFLVIIALLLLGGLLGGLSVFCIKKLHIPSWLSGLSLTSFFYAISHLYLHRADKGLLILDGFTDAFMALSSFSLGSDPTYSFPLSVIVSILLCLSFWVLVRYTKTGKKIFSSKEIPLLSVLFLFYTAFFLSACGGILNTSYEGLARSDFGFDYLFDIVAICLLSGFSFFSKKGKLPFIILGTFIYTSACYAIDFTGLGHFIPFLLRALVIIAYVTLDIYLIRRDSQVTSEIESILVSESDIN